MDRDIGVAGVGIFDIDVIGGELDGDFSGGTVAPAGDVNGDGLDDLLIGSPSSNGDSVAGVSETGTSYLLISPLQRPPYAGLWTLNPANNYICTSLWGSVDAQLNHLTIDHQAPYANLTGVPELTMDPRSAQPGILEGGFVAGATPDSFVVERSESLGGNCAVTWSLDGSYTSIDTLSATFTATFTGSCGDCSNQSYAVTGTR